MCGVAPTHLTAGWNINLLFFFSSILINLIVDAACLDVW
jgi:hypothetical protein